MLFPKKITYSFLSFLVTIKIWQIILFIFALYFSALFLFSSNSTKILPKLNDINLHGIIISSLFSVMAGMLINYFYDHEKDILFQPIRTSLKKFISFQNYLYLYIFLNTISLIISSLLSFKIFIFFLVYQILIWFYSHKISKIFFLNNIFWSSLTILPFFALTIHYQIISIKIIFLSFYLFLLLIIKEIFKDINTLKSDILFDYNTLPIKIGIRKTIYVIIIFLFFLILISIYLIIHFNFNWMNYYFITGILFFLSLIIYLVIKKNNYSPYIELLIKIWIGIGVFSIPDYILLYSKFKNIF